MAISYLQSALFMLNRPEPIRQASLLMILADGVGHGDALIDGLRAHAASSGSPWSDRVNSLRLLLEQGVPLSAALSSNGGMLPESTLYAIVTAESTGTLKQVLADEALRLSQSQNDPQSVGFDPINMFMYLNCLSVVLVAIVSFLLVYIVPKLKKVFEDFSVALPDATTTVIDTSEAAMHYAVIIFPLAMSFLMGTTVLISRAAYLKLAKGHLMFSEHWPRWWIPDVLRLSGLCVAAGQPLTQCLHIMLREMRPGRAARELSGVRHAADAGESFVQALFHRKLLRRREADFLAAAERTGHLDWALRHLAAHLERSRASWFRKLVLYAWPVVFALMGMLVYYVVSGFFSALVELQMKHMRDM